MSKTTTSRSKARTNYRMYKARGGHWVVFYASRGFVRQGKGSTPDLALNDFYKELEK